MRLSKPATALITLMALSLLGCEQQPMPKNGTLVIESEPLSGAEITVNGRTLGERTDATIDDLEPGIYRIDLVRAPGEGVAATQTGEAEVEVEAGRLSRIVIGLNPMEIVPATIEDGVRPRTRGQKSIFDFYAALSEGDPARAYTYLGSDPQRASGYLRGFTKTWELVERIDITDLRLESFDPTAAIEASIVTLNIFEATETTPLPAPHVRIMSITTTEKGFGGPGLPRILELSETSAADPDSSAR